MIMRTLAAPIALLALSTGALAHPGHGAEGFGAGLAHPLLGLDHLAALLLVGAWSTSFEARRSLVPPLAFLAAIGAGFGLAALGVRMPGIETVIALSLIAFGGVVALAWRAPLAAAALGIAGFGLFHGQAHWIEAGTDGGFIAGVIAASALVIAVGYAVTRAISRLPVPAGRAAGLVGALAGVVALAVAA